jgi:hypothetical protein
MSLYTDQQLQDVWDRYVGMKEAEVISLISPSSAVYDASFAGTLAFIYTNKLFGFAYNNAGASSNQFKGNVPIVSGPLKS